MQLARTSVVLFTVKYFVTELNGDEGMSDKQCIHYWIIDNRDVGRCRYCGAVKDFRGVLENQSEELSQRQAKIARDIAGYGKRRGRPPALRED